MKWQTSKYGWLLGHVQTLPPGEAHLAQYGSQYQCLPQSFAAYVYAAAIERGYKATVAIIDRNSGSSVVYAFYRPTDYMRPNLPAYPIVKKMRGE